MALEVTPPPLGLQDAVSKHFMRSATLRDNLPIDYVSLLTSLWNGTVYVYKLAGSRWPKTIYAFRVLDSNGQPNWKAYPQGPNTYPTPLAAVKAALQEKWSAEMSLGAPEPHAAK
jgi:hypothetical protein